MNNEQQSKPDPKGKAIASFVLGIISSIPTPLLLMLIVRKYSGRSLVWGFGGTTDLLIAPIVLLIAFGWPIFMGIGLFGLLYGIKGLKSTKKNFAITGIVLCIISLLSIILYFVVPNISYFLRG